MDITSYVGCIVALKMPRVRDDGQCGSEIENSGTQLLQKAVLGKCTSLAPYDRSHIMSVYSL